MAVEMPTATATTKVTVIGPVATPPESKAIPIKVCVEKKTRMNANK